MNKAEFDSAVKSFDLKRYKEISRQAVADRDAFVKKFTISFIKEMDIDDYVSGKYRITGAETFCYVLERKLGCLGSIVGAPAHKFGIFFKNEVNEYVIANRYWNKGSITKSFAFLRSELANLIEAGRNADMETIRQSKFSPMFKGKILATYFPEDYLSIFSEEHIDYFIHRLDLDHNVKSDADINDKKQVLVQFKESIPEMSKWSLHAFSHFLYTVYPGRPSDNDDESENISYIDKIEMIDGDFISINDTPEVTKPGKGDYAAQQRARASLGERGEYIVMQYEMEHLKKLGIKKKPKQVSLTDDTLGYDIESYDETGAKIKIEVKATNAAPKDFHFFFTANELSAAKQYKENYRVYIVFKPNSSNPKIFNLGNPFMEEGKMNLIPVSYKLHIQKV